MAAARIDWGALSSKLKPEAVNALNAFRRRHSDLTKTLNELNASASRSVDLAPYRSVLKNQKVVVAAESALKTFKPATLDLPLQIRAIEQHEALAVEQASKTATTIKAQLADLDVLLSSIETARPVDQLKLADIQAAIPEHVPLVEKMIKRGQWHVPGYFEKFGKQAVGF